MLYLFTVFQWQKVSPPAKKKNCCYHSIRTQKIPCASIHCVEIVAMATATDAQPHRYKLTSKRIRINCGIIPFSKGHFILPHLFVYISIVARISRFGHEIFSHVFSLNGRFYGYSPSHKLYFEQTNTSCMTEQTIFFLCVSFWPTQFNSAR